MSETVKMQYDCDAKIFIEKLLQNGYWVKFEKCKLTSERMQNYITIRFKKDDNLDDESED